MNIIDSLSNDIRQILQMEMTKPRFDHNRLVIYLWLLIGHERFVKNTKVTNVTHEEDESDSSDEIDENEIYASDTFKNEKIVQLEAFKSIREQVKAFCYRNPYLNYLLFRDFNSAYKSQFEDKTCMEFGTVLIHQEAIRYVEEVLLMKPLQLARKNGDKPTNLHLLFRTLCRFSDAPGNWTDSDITRSDSAKEESAPWFDKLGQLLRKQYQKPNNKVNVTALNRQNISGSYWFNAGGCYERVCEELTLLNVLQMTPVPLNSSFAQDEEFSRLLKGSIDSLNMRYRWLRSCGLPPEDWLQADKPSIEHLKELANLRKHAVATDEWFKEDYLLAFKTVFNELAQTNNHKWAGFNTFEEWRNSDVGDAILMRSSKHVVSLTELLTDAKLDIPDNKSEVIHETVDLSIKLETIQAEVGERLTPVLSIFFEQVLLEGGELYGDNGLLENSHFLQAALLDINYTVFSKNILTLKEQLADCSPLMRDELLNTKLNWQMQIAEKLFIAVRQIIFSMLIQDKMASPLLQNYLEHVVICERPTRGTDGLFNKKSFKNLLAHEVDLKILSPEQLEAELARQAHNLISVLFHEHF